MKLNEEAMRLTKNTIDAEASAHAKHDASINPAAATLHACIYGAVRAAVAQGNTRRTIERRAGMGTKTLGDYLSAKPDRTIKHNELAMLLFDPSVLGKQGHEELVRLIALKAGRKLLCVQEQDETDSMVEEALDVGDATGNLLARVRDAVHPDSPGGTRITPEEQAGIGACGRVVLEEVMVMIPHVPGHAGRDR